MLDKQTIIEKILQVKFNPNQVVTLHEIVDGCTVTVKAMSDELLYFRYKVDEQEKFTSLLDFSLKDGYVNFYYSGEEGSQLAKACVLDVLIPTLYELIYNPPKEVQYNAGYVDNFSDFSVVVEKAVKKSKIYDTVVVTFTNYTKACEIMISNNRLTYKRGDVLVLGMTLVGDCQITVYDSYGCEAMLNSLLRLKDFD